MNATNSSSADKELESLRRAQRAYEPSMEEILASIRSIIADDKESPAAPAAAPKPAVPGGPQIVYSKDSPTLQPPAAPPTAAPPPAAPPPAAAPVEAAPAPAPTPPRVAWEKPAPRVQAAPPAPTPSPAEAAPIVEEPFVSPSTDAAVSASFGALSASVALQNSEMIDGLAREMLRPMLKTWLDDNLPSLVERLVRAEIQRVARGGR
ncbi:MAG: DUF2497 domain-containing protein [Roseiarcus sp.]|jgi:uncharacterized protein